MENIIAAEQVYKLAQEKFGIVPGVIKEMGERSPSVAYLYTSGTNTMSKSSLGELEINAIELKFSKMNNCESCVKGHTYLVKKAGMSDADALAIVNNQTTSSERINKLIKASEYIYHSGGSVFSDFALEYFEEEEITEKEIMEIIGLLSLKTISNYVNNYLISKKRRQLV